METALFLQQLFGDIAGQWLLIWTLQNKQSHWFRDPAEAVVAVKDELDCYVGVALADKDHGGHVRLKPEDGRLPTGIVGLWADIDVAGPAHKKANLPPTVEDARGLVCSVDRRPTVTVWSGHGFQAWWLFKEPWLFESDEERKKAAALAESWCRLFQRKAAARGWTIDSVYDLTRVMRLPGTKNHKCADVVEAKILEASWSLRYSPEDFENFEVEDIKVKPKYQCKEVVLSADANPPFEKFEALKENETDFARTWDHRRKLDSNSDYEWWLALYASQAGWTDQEIANLIITHRRKWDGAKLDKVTTRRDYVENIINKIRGDGERDEAIRMLAAGIDGEDKKAAEGVAASDQRKAKDLELLSAVFGVRIERWVQFGKEKPIYRLELVNGVQIKIGTVAAVTDNYRAFSRAIYAETGFVMEPVSKKTWAGVLAALTRVVEIVEAPDASQHVTVRSAVEFYLQKQNVYGAGQEDMACREAAPFNSAGILHIPLEPMRRWFTMHGLDRWEKHELLDSLHSIGFKRTAIHYRGNSGKLTTRSYYLVNTSEFEESVTANPVQSG